MAAEKWKSFGTLLAGAIGMVLIIAFIVYMITKALIKEPAAAPIKTCPRCKETVAPDATRCKFCTSEI